MSVSFEEAQAVLSRAECLHTVDEINVAFDQMAAAITDQIGESEPLVICVMQGGLIPTGLLLSRLSFPLQIDYLHASRYGGRTRGGELDWKVLPHHELQGRTVLLVDDIHDEGVTLKAIIEHCKAHGAETVLSAVLINKVHDRKGAPPADFVGLDVVDRYLFGYGMDYKGHLRNASGIYAVYSDDE